MAFTEFTVEAWVNRLENLFCGGFWYADSVTLLNGAYINTQIQAPYGYRYVGDCVFNDAVKDTSSGVSISHIVTRYSPTSYTYMWYGFDGILGRPVYNLNGNSAGIDMQIGEQMRCDVSFVYGNGYCEVNDDRFIGTIISGYNTTSGTNTNICLGLNSVSTTFVGDQLIYDRYGELILQLRPAIRRSDGICGMLDMIYGNFYTNQGNSDSEITAAK